MDPVFLSVAQKLRRSGASAGDRDHPGIRTCEPCCHRGGSGGIAQRELIAHWETLRAFGNKSAERSG